VAGGVEGAVEVKAAYREVAGRCATAVGTQWEHGAGADAARRWGHGDGMAEPTRILIADADQDARCTLGAQLRGDGYAVRTAADSEAALQEAERRLPQLAIIDLLVPTGEGFELAGRLRRLGDVPVILLTALDDEETRVRGLEGYAQDYVTKPFSYRELRARIRRVLGASARGGRSWLLHVS
jgi:CheY-like chemotaxis protein